MRVIIYGLLLAAAAVIGIQAVNAKKPLMTVKVQNVAAKDDVVEVIAFTDKGGGLAQFEVLACGNLLTFTVDTKAFTPAEFSKYVNETIDKVCK